MRIFFILSLTLCTMHLSTLASQSSTEKFKANFKEDGAETLRKIQDTRKKNVLLEECLEKREKRFGKSQSLLNALNNKLTQQAEQNFEALREAALRKLDLALQGKEAEAASVAQIQEEIKAREGLLVENKALLAKIAKK